MLDTWARRDVRRIVRFATLVIPASHMGEDKPRTALRTCFRVLRSCIELERSVTAGIERFYRIANIYAS